MILKTNISNVKENPDLEAFLRINQMFGLPVEPTRGVNTASFDFAAYDHESLISKDEFDMLIALDPQVWISGATIYSQKLTEAKLDAALPVGFTRSSVADGEDGETRQLTIREYVGEGHVFPVVDGIIILFSRKADNNGNTLPPGDALLREWIAAMDGKYSVKRRGLALIAEYEAAQGE